VAANGPESTRFKPGDIVIGATMYDAQAELVNVPEKYLIPVPENLATTDGGHQKVAAIALDWSTAYGMVDQVAKVKEGQTVFIHGLSGAVGHAAMALCQLKGAKVYGTASKRNHAELVRLGATPFEYVNKDWIKAMQEIGGADAVFDALGFESWDESYQIVNPKGGILVGFGGNLGPLKPEGRARWIVPYVVKLMARNLMFWSRKRTAFYAGNRDDKTFAPNIVALMDLYSEGKIQVPIRKVWALTTEEIREAHRSWGKVSGIGSILIRVAGSTE
jgi:synaptic vesicle membrane protein VAT-1